MLPPFRFFSVLLLTLLVAVTAPAQTLPSSAATVAPRLTRADTARAIHRLFRSRREGRILWLAYGTAAVLASTLPALQATSAGVWTPGVVAGSAAMLIGINKGIQFRPGRERRILRELAATGHLPAGVVRRLRGNFTPVIGGDDEYNPLLAKGVYDPNSPQALTATQWQAIARADTLRAIAHLFERRRHGTKRWLFVSAMGLLSAVSNVQSAQRTGARTDAGGVLLVGTLALGVPAAAIIGNQIAYSEKREEEVDRNFRAGQPLPKRIRHRLKKKDFE